MRLSAISELEKLHMKVKSIPHVAAWAGLVTLVLGIQTAIAAPLVYVPLGGEGKVVVIDSAKDEVVGTIGGLVAVHGLAGTPDGRFLIAGSYQERAPGEGMPAKPAAVSEEEHAAHHGGMPKMAQESGATVSTVSVVQTSNGAVVRRIDVPGAVHHVAVSPDGRYAVVTHPNEGAISAIDLKTYEVVAHVRTGPFTNYAAFAPDSKTVYVSNAGDSTVSAVDTGRWAVQWSATVGTSPEHLVLAKDGGTLYVNNIDDGSVSVIQTNAGKVVKTIPIGSTLHGIDLSDDGRILFVSDLGDDKVVAYDLTTGAYRSAHLTPAPYHVAAVHGTDKLYVSSADEPKVWVLNQDDLSVRGEIPIGGKGHQMFVGPGT
jgi:YVTN family beta-propeller protein